MNELEHRLHHAARELRGIEIEPPPLASVPAPRRPTGLAGRVPTLVMPVLFVLGGLAVIAGGLGRTTESTDALPTPASVDDGHVTEQRPDSEAPRVAATRRPLTAHQEIALIASLAPMPTPADEIAEPAASPPIQSDTRSYR